ncbi:ABC transporter permease [Streptomyces sp. NPDC048508]|uniref:ABC transporter permease n=1 Tax=Streptomyces sp. NPDC048508 TaxID=3365561 RepID=UPI0037123284
MRDAITLRAVMIMAGVLLLQLAFALSYMGALHNPRPHKIALDVVAPAVVSPGLVERINALPNEPLNATAVSDKAQAEKRLLDRSSSAALVVRPAARADILMIASAGGPSVADATEQIVQKIEKAQLRAVQVEDIRPPAKGDGNGVSSFYLVLSWTIGGYLAASALNMAAGSKRPSLKRTSVRLAAMVPYAVVSGIGGAIIVGPVLHSLPGAFWDLVGLGVLIVLAGATVGVALQSLAGTVGLGLTILTFTVLGNPSSGGIYPAALLPPFWAAIGQALPPGAGTTAVRNTVYFDGHDTAGAVWILIAWVFGGVLVAVVSALLRDRREQARHGVEPA